MIQTHAAGFTVGFLLLAQSLISQTVPVQEKFLANGLKVLLIERHDSPDVAGGWVARVGSANERPGITGIAHLFEHMMFKGTPTIGTKDYKRDLKIINEQERVRGLMREEESKMRAAWRRGEIDDPFKIENRTARYKELDVEFKKLVDDQRSILVKNEFDRIYTTGGASGMNAYTSYDMTAYFITVPANKLELFMWMESERLLRPVFREFYAERDVVFEERRMRTDSTPTGKFDEAFSSMIWESHPYSWPVIGWPSDIPAISKEQADEFYATYYAPQNLTLILVGDFKSAETLKQVEQYFGRIPKGKKPAPEVITLEMKPNAEKRMYAEAETNPQVEIVWHTVPFGHKDSYALTVLGQILSTRTGRLYKNLVLGSKVATSSSAGQHSLKYAGLFYADGECREGNTPEAVEKAIYSELEKTQQTLVPAEELQKVKNNFAASEFRRLSGNHAILQQLMRSEGTGDWREINESGKKIQAVTTADIQRVAKTYFAKENRAVIVYTRKPSASGAAPAPALSDDQQKQFAAAAQKIKAETDAGKLKMQLEAMEMQAQQIPPAIKPLFDRIQKTLKDRITELEKK